MTRLRGWPPKGERLVDKVPQGKWKTATFLAALRNDRIDAPCLFDGPINGERFRAYVEQVLVPTLKLGDVVILDNLGSHKGKAVRKAIRDVGARLVFLPKYCPDLNPIEQVFAKFKTLLRMAEARTYEAISDASANIRAQSPLPECAAYIKNAGDSGFPNRPGSDSRCMPARRLACMARSLSVDLRRRVVGAIEGGLSCRAAVLYRRPRRLHRLSGARGEGGGRVEQRSRASHDFRCSTSMKAKSNGLALTTLCSTPSRRA